METYLMIRLIGVFCIRKKKHKIVNSKFSTNFREKFELFSYFLKSPFSPVEYVNVLFIVLVVEMMIIY